MMIRVYKIILDLLGIISLSLVCLNGSIKDYIVGSKVISLALFMLICIVFSCCNRVFFNSQEGGMIRKSGILLVLVFSIVLSSAFFNTASAVDPDDTVTTVICNIINFVQGIGLPIMTGVIIGSSIMAIFGRLAWPAIVVLVVFTAIFFGASKVMTKFVDGLSIAKSVADSKGEVCSKKK